MKLTRELVNLVSKAKQCASNEKKNRQFIDDLLNDIASIMETAFVSNNQQLDEENFIEKLTYLQYATYALGLATETRKLTFDETADLLQIVISSMCAYKDGELAKSFDRILDVLLGCATKLDINEYEDVLLNLLDIVKYCETESSSIPYVSFKFISPKTITRIETDEDRVLKHYLSRNIISALLRKSSCEYIHTSFFLLFWPYCIRHLKSIQDTEDIWIIEHCLRAGLNILKRIKKLGSLVEQASFIDSLFIVFPSLISHKYEVHNILTEIIEEVEVFIAEHEQVLFVHKELKERMLVWLEIYLDFTGDTFDDFGLLGSFSSWLVSLTSDLENYELPSRLCVGPIDRCVQRILKSMQTGVSDCLDNYLDILAALFDLARIQKADNFQWFITEVEKHESLENPHWSRILMSLLSVQHPQCQLVCKKFAPSVEKLWQKLKNDELSWNTVNEISIAIASCSFLNKTDEGAKQILPFLLLPCFREFRERIGSKWDNFRIVGGQSVGVAELIDLERFASELETNTSESMKLHAVHCALQIDKKTGKYIQLAADLSLAVLSKSQTDKIAHCLPSLVQFLNENQQFIHEFVTILMEKLSENRTIYSEKTLLEICKTIRKLVCLAANGSDQCKKCEQRGFVVPDKKDLIKFDEMTFSLLVKGIMDNRHKLSTRFIGEFLQTCQVILLHVETKKISSVFTPVIKALDVAFSENCIEFFRVWELVCWRSEASSERRMQVYVPFLIRTLSLRGDGAAYKLDSFSKNVLNSHLPTDVKVIVIAACFAHTVIVNSEIYWNLISNWSRLFAFEIVKDSTELMEDDLLQTVFKRYVSIFTCSFVYGLFFEATTIDDSRKPFDELKIREIGRRFVSQVLIYFKFPNLVTTVTIVRPSLLYWSLSFGSRGPNADHACSLIDFICQELNVNTILSGLPNLCDMQTILNQRKTLITEFFPQIVQLWTFENNKKSKSVWKFCAEYCHFKEEDLRSVTSTFRKEVFVHILLVSPKVFMHFEGASPIADQLRETYENMKKGEKFTISTAMDTRNEGIEFMLYFRMCFTSDSHFMLRNIAASSFHIVLQNLKPDFFDVNWYAILMTLRLSPSYLDSTRRSWIVFVEQLNYSILRTNLWRIFTDLSNVSRNEEIIEQLWKRFSYANEIDKISVDGMMKRVFWMIPLSVEKKVDLNFTIAKSRKVDDVFQFIRNFSRYPSVQFLDNLASKINRGAVWKDDLPKLIGALVGILPSCQTEEQRNKFITVLQKVPIMSSELADYEFVRWTSGFNFFSEPRQLTQAVLEECAEIVETMPATGKVQYADRTMCEIYKFFNETGISQEMQASLDGLKFMFAKMTCSQKPQPALIEQRCIDELCNPGARPRSFARWLTVLILKCAKMAEDTPLASLVSISHIDNTRYLAKLAMRFILTVIYMEKDSVTQWVLTKFEEALTHTNHQRLTSSDRSPAAFVFYVFDFLYSYSNTEELRKNKKNWEKVIAFWRSMIGWSIKDEHGHELPLIVKVAESFGMEKRCILWLEMYMEQKRKTDKVESETESAYFFYLMNLYARIHELNGVRGSYSRLCKVQIDHVYGKICIREAFGDFNSASSFAKMTGKGKPFDANEAIKKLIDDVNDAEYFPNEIKEQNGYLKSLKSLSEWVKDDDYIGPSPHVFSKTIESRSIETKIMTMIQNRDHNEAIDNAIKDAKSRIVDRLAECSLGGSCSYETAIPFIVDIQALEEICMLNDANNEDLVSFDSELWRNLYKRTNEGEQKMSVLEPILRVRRSMLGIRMKAMTGRDKESLRSRIVESHLHIAQIARLSGCFEQAQLSLINAKKIMPFENKIVLEEAKLQLQTSDELSGMNLLDSIISKNFGDLQTIYTDTQQSVNLDIQRSAKLKIEQYQGETKNLFSSVQMLRISHMIKAGNTIGFDKIYDETTQLLHCFAHSGVMHEAAWLLDYLSNYKEHTKHVLPLIKAYKEVAKYERNQVLQARAVERMTSLWLSNTRKISSVLSSSTKLPEGQTSDHKQNIKSMNREIQLSLDHIGWRAFYPAYAVLAQHIDHQDDEVARTIKQLMKQLILRMPHQCMWQSAYLLRQDIAAIKEKYMDVLAEVKRKAPCYVTLIDQYDYASGVFNMVSGKINSDTCKLSEKVEGLKVLFRDRKYDPRDLVMNRRLEGDCKVLNGIMVPIRSVINESLHAPDNCDEGFEESCHLPDRYLIHDFSEKIKVLQSQTKPVIIELTTMAGGKVRLICKKDDDLTKDYHFTKMVEMCNDLLMKDEQTKVQKITATTYSVIPLAKKGGIIEFMEEVTPFYDTLEKLLGISEKEWKERIKSWDANMKPLSKEDRAKYFREVACKNTPVVMGKWFRIKYPEAGQWYASRKLFAKSTAVMSIIGYIFGLGDRHTKNLMVHSTGKCVHVDFDMIFNKGETLGTPEVVPFRLTQNMINGMGEVALDGEFRTVCEQALRVFRENSYEIEKYIADLPNMVADFPSNNRAAKEFDMTEAKRLVSGRLRGQIMTFKLYRGNPISHPMHVSQLASSLIELATSDEKLSEMFIGWLPTL